MKRYLLNAWATFLLILGVGIYAEATEWWHPFVGAALLGMFVAEMRDW